MLDIFLLIFFGFKIHKLAVSKGLVPNKWVLNFVLSYVAASILFVVALIFAVGKDTFSNPEKLKEIIPYLPLSLLVEVGLFFFFRSRLMRYPDVEYYDDETPPSSSDNNNEPPQKDLSYFR